MPPRILSLATLYPNAANPRFGTFVARQFEALNASGAAEVTVVNPIGTPPFAPGRYAALAAAAVDGTEHGVPIHRPLFTLIPRFGGRWNPGAIARAVLPLARRLHAECPFDVVDAQFFSPDGPAAARIAAALSLPLSIKARGADISFWGQRSYARAAMQRAATQAAGLLAVSEALARDMAAIGLPRDKIAIHYTGLDRTRFHPRDRTQARAQVAERFGLTLPAGEPLLATIGALIPRKGQALVIEALERVGRGQLLLAGQGEDRGELERQAAAEGLAGRVHFLGNLDHEALPQVLAASDAMVLPSASEGLANAWVEALACGTPLVITNAGGARELVRDDSAGRIVERGATAIAAGIEQVLASNYAPQSVALTVERFSWAANARELARYYADLAASG